MFERFSIQILVTGFDVAFVERSGGVTLDMFASSIEVLYVNGLLFFFSSFLLGDSARSQCFPQGKNIDLASSPRGAASPQKRSGA
jgi:hypothetical protein